MNKHCSGFSIIECLVYCFLFCLLCVLIFDWVGASQISLSKIHKKADRLLNELSAMDLLVKDIMESSAAQADWKKITETQIVWQSQNEAIGWEWRDAALYRISGTYANDQWSHSTKNLVNDSISCVNFKVSKNKAGQIVRVAINLGKANRIVTLRNRKIYAQK